MSELPHVLNIKIYEKIKNLTEVPFWIAGGAALAGYTSKFTSKDVDIYCSDAEALLNDITEDFNFIKETPNAYLFTIFNKPVEIIKIHQGTDIHKILDTFDLSITKIAWDGVDYIFGDGFEYSQENKICQLGRVTKPLHTLQRVIKYANRGYMLNDEGVLELAKIIQKFEESFDSPENNLITLTPEGKKRVSSSYDY